MPNMKNSMLHYNWSLNHCIYMHIRKIKTYRSLVFLGMCTVIKNDILRVQDIAAYLFNRPCKDKKRKYDMLSINDHVIMLIDNRRWKCACMSLLTNTNANLAQERRIIPFSYPCCWYETYVIHSSIIRITPDLAVINYQKSMLVSIPNNSKVRTISNHWYH